MASTDHIVSFTISAAIHLLGMLLIGYLITHPREPDITEPAALDVSSVELSLSEEEMGQPGAAQTSAAQDTTLPTIRLPEPISQPDQPQLPDKPDFSDALPLPEPIPEPVPLPPAPQPVPAPVPPAPPPPPPAPTPPQATPLPPDKETAATGAASKAILPAVDMANGNGTESNGGASGHIDGHPSLERKIRPSYPIGARRRGEEGTVILDVVVSVDGRATRVTLVSSSGFQELDRAAERAASQARFKPGTRDGQPRESSARLTLIFRLRDF